MDLLSNRSLRRALHSCETKSGYDGNVRRRLSVMGPFKVGMLWRCLISLSKGVQDLNCGNRVNVMFQENTATRTFFGYTSLLNGFLQCVSVKESNTRHLACKTCFASASMGFCFIYFLFLLALT